MAEQNRREADMPALYPNGAQGAGPGPTSILQLPCVQTSQDSSTPSKCPMMPQNSLAPLAAQ